MADPIYSSTLHFKRKTSTPSHSQPFPKPAKQTKSAHGVPKNRSLRRIDRKLFANQRDQLVDYIRVHSVVLGPFLLGCVHIEARSFTKIIGCLVTFDVEVPRRGVGVDDDDTMMRCK